MKSKIVRSHKVSKGTPCPLCGELMKKSKIISIEAVDTVLGAAQRTLNCAVCPNCEYWYPINREDKAFW